MQMMSRAVHLALHQTASRLLEIKPIAKMGLCLARSHHHHLDSLIIRQQPKHLATLHKHGWWHRDAVEKHSRYPVARHLHADQSRRTAMVGSVALLLLLLLLLLLPPCSGWVELLHEGCVGTHGILLGQGGEGGPRLPLGPPHGVEHAGLGRGVVADGGLLVQRVHLEHLVAARRRPAAPLGPLHRGAERLRDAPGGHGPAAPGGVGVRGRGVPRCTDGETCGSLLSLVLCLLAGGAVLGRDEPEVRE
mmetsp:Transcript_32567/g.63623  ORF Transcript_32567/g.63623 Transcript_32567/m.63623 type:complete len:248 (+) Transcript_32567:440-1183(+)